jgi:bifunctional DNase/RNase
VDCRPSDAIALAVQTGARMFVARDVLDVVAPGPGNA